LVVASKAPAKGLKTGEDGGRGVAVFLREEKKGGGGRRRNRGAESDPHRKWRLI